MSLRRVATLFPTHCVYMKIAGADSVRVSVSDVLSMSTKVVQTWLLMCHLLSIV